MMDDDRVEGVLMKKKKVIDKGIIRFTISQYSDGMIITRENTLKDNDFIEMFIPNSVLKEICKMMLHL